MISYHTIWTNGCFDILHIGHIRLFKYAKSLGNWLIVGIDSDERVKQLKGKDRPINNQDNRREFLLGVRYVDEVFIFDDEKHMCDILIANNISTMEIGRAHV